MKAQPCTRSVLEKASMQERENPCKFKISDELILWFNLLVLYFLKISLSRYEFKARDQL